MVLLVEDEVLVRELVEGILMRAGYEVTSAASAEEALQLAPAIADRMTLLVTDVALPGMDGTQVSRQLQAQIPHLKIIHMSGNPGDAERRESVLAPGTLFLRKPFSRAELLAAVKQLIGE